MRALITTAVQSYRDGDFGQSERVLVRAQNRWRDTNPKDNREVSDWLALVRRAISLKKGWEIGETDALYGEIMQLFEIATENYKKGVRLRKDGRLDEAQQAFEKARETLDTIKIPFPLLKLANTLELTMARFADKEAFNRDFNAEKQSTLAVLRGGIMSQMQEKYAILKVYAEIVPTDRQMLSLIVELEYGLGIKIRPPSPASIAKSKESYTTARVIYDQRQRDLYDQAVELLNSAIKLWPENQQAVLLKDRILIDTGGARQDIISRDDSKQLETAERLFSERNYAESYSIVQVLLQKASNRNYPRLLDLQEKLELRLGI